MDLTPEIKEEIDSMSYRQLLSKWRFAPIGDVMFQGESGKYFADRMAELKKKIGPGGHTSTSKSIGW